MDYEANVAWTAALAAKAHELGVAVEAELGKLAGEEDGLSVPEVEAKMTDPQQVWWRCDQRQPWLLGVALNYVIIESISSLEPVVIRDGTFLIVRRLLWYRVRFSFTATAAELV